MAVVETPHGFAIGSYLVTVEPGAAILHVGRIVGRLFFGGSRKVIVDTHATPNVFIRKGRVGGTARFRRSTDHVVIHTWGNAERFASALTQAGFAVAFDSN